MPERMRRREPAIHLRSRAGSAVAACGRRPLAPLAYPREVDRVTCGHCRRSIAGRAAIAAFDPPPPPPPPPPADPALRVDWQETKIGRGWDGVSEDGWRVHAHPLGLAGISVHAIDPEKVSHFHHRLAGVARADMPAVAAELYAEIRARPERHSPRRAAERRARGGAPAPTEVG